MHEDDREFSAVLSAGTKFGSLFMLRQIQQEEKVLKEKLACMDYKVERWLDERQEGGGGNVHEGGDTPPASPYASSDHSLTETEALSPNLSSRSLIPPSYEEIGLSAHMGCPAGLNADLDYITEVEEARFASIPGSAKVDKGGS